MQSTLQPVQSESRIWIIDALRGFAILGIFIANLKGFTFYNPEAVHSGQYFTSYDKSVDFLHTILIEGKFYSIFSFLFGWGIALQLQRNESKGITSVRIIRRRLVFMILLGLAHLVLIWFGDIVMFYGLLTFVLLWVRNWKDKTLFITSILLLLSPILLYFLKMKFPWANAPYGFIQDTALYLHSHLNTIKSEEEFLNAVHTMNYFQHVKLNIIGVFFRYADLFFQSRISKVLGMFILGFLTGKNERFKIILNNMRLLWQIAIAGLIVGLTGNYFFAKLHSGRSYYSLTPQGLQRTIAYAFGVAPLAISYMSLFFLAAKSNVGKKIISALQPVGKMAFTNYILHSIIGLLMFTGVGFAMDRQVGPVYYTVFAFTVFALQIILSKVWLSYFEYGPVEWLWRSFTYEKVQPFKKISGTQSNS